MMDIQSWWPGENPRLTRDRPISLFSSQARTKIQSPSKNFDWQYYFATTNHLQHQLTTIILCKGQIMETCFSFIISTPCFVFGALWGLRWGGIDQTENPLVSPTLPLLLLDYPSRIWIPRKSTPAILWIPLSRANKWILDPRPPPPLTSENNYS